MFKLRNLFMEYGARKRSFYFVSFSKILKKLSFLSVLLLKCKQSTNQIEHLIIETNVLFNLEANMLLEPLSSIASWFWRFMEQAERVWGHDDVVWQLIIFKLCQITSSWRDIRSACLSRPNSFKANGTNPSNPSLLLAYQILRINSWMLFFTIRAKLFFTLYCIINLKFSH